MAQRVLLGSVTIVSPIVIWRGEDAAGYDAIRNLSKGLQDFATDNRIFEASMLILVCGRRCGSAGLPLSPHNFLGVKIALGDGQLAAGTLLLDLGGTMLDDVFDLADACRLDPATCSSVRTSTDPKVVCLLPYLFASAHAQSLVCLAFFDSSLRGEGPRAILSKVLIDRRANWNSVSNASRPPCREIQLSGFVR